MFGNFVFSDLRSDCDWISLGWHLYLGFFQFWESNKPKANLLWLSEFCLLNSFWFHSFNLKKIVTKRNQKVLLLAACCFIVKWCLFLKKPIWTSNPKIPERAIANNISHLFLSSDMFNWYSYIKGVVLNLFCFVDPLKSKKCPWTPKVFKALLVDPYIPLKEV